MKKLLCVSILLLGAVAASAQGSNGGVLYASDFANWSLPQANTPAFGQIQWTSSQICQVSATGYTFTGPKTGRPVRIVDANSTLSETVTPTNVIVNGGFCSLTASMANAHYTYHVGSGTAGLQEAIDYQSGLAQGSVVVLTPAWTVAGGTTGMITAAIGNANVSILDERTNTFKAYNWNGSAYVVAPFITTAAGLPSQVQFNNAGLLGGSLATLDTAGNFATPAGLAAVTVSAGAIPVASLPAASGKQGSVAYVTDLLNPENCGTGGSGDYGLWPCVSNGVNWFSTGAMPTVGVPLVVRRSAFNSGLSALKSALADEFHQYVNINLTASDSITWGLSATGTGTTTPRNHLLTDVRATLTGNTWANKLRDYLGQTYFGGTAAVADFGTTITAQSPGTGYSGAWTMAFTGGTCSIQPTGTVTLSGSGLVFAMVNPGDCTVAPTAATFTGGTPGSGASVTVGSAGNGVGSYSRTVYIAVNDPAITYFGNSLVTNAGNLTGTAMDLTANTSFASFNFYGDSFTLIYDQLPGTGTYDLIVDGVNTGTFGVNGTTTFNVTRFHTLGTVGQHTVKILNSSTPDDKVRIGALQILRKMRLANNGLIGTKSAEWGHTGALLDGTLHSDDEFIFSAIGTNDATNTTTPPYAASQLKANYGSIVRYLQGLNLKVILIQQNNVGQTPACTENPASLTQPYCQLDAANALTTVANTYDVDLINQYPSTSAYNAWNIPCITAAPHPGDVCQTLMASNIENAIEQNATPIGSSNGNFTGLNTFTNTVTFSSAAGATANTSFVDSTFPGASFQETFLSDVSGDATIFNNPITGTGSANATWSVFRQTNTSGQVRMNIYKGDGTATVTSFISGKVSSALGFGLCLGQTTCVPAFGLTVNGVTTGNAQLTLLDGGFTNSTMQMSAVSDVGNDMDFYLNPVISGGSAHAQINLFRTTSTTGLVRLNFEKGNNTATITAFVDAATGGFGPQVLTVGTLPTCNSSRKEELIVSDATAPTYLATLTGGGAIFTPVFCDGTSWRSY